MPDTDITDITEIIETTSYSAADLARDLNEDDARTLAGTVPHTDLRLNQVSYPTLRAQIQVLLQVTDEQPEGQRKQALRGLIDFVEHLQDQAAFALGQEFAGEHIYLPPLEEGKEGVSS